MTSHKPPIIPPRPEKRESGVTLPPSDDATSSEAELGPGAELNAIPPDAKVEKLPPDATIIGTPEQDQHKK